MPVVKKETMEICNQKKMKSVDEMSVQDDENTETQKRKNLQQRNTVEQAVKALKLLNKKFVDEDLKKQPLLEDAAESPIYLQVMLKKIPPPQLTRMIKVTLPHTILNETSEVCLITGDLDKRDHKAEVEPTIMHYKDLLKKNNVTNVAQVIPLRQLRTEYKTYESRRQLSAAYDVFLTDKKIAGVIPKTLGKSFFQSRKFPIQIDLTRRNLKDQIDKALCQTEFSLTCRGNSYALEVARLSMEDDAIVENLMASVEIIGNKLPGNMNNILSLYLKTAKSKAIPIFVSLDIPDEMLIKKPRKNEKYKLDELSTMDDAEVKVFRDGRVIVRKMKKDSTDKDTDIAEKDDDAAENESDLVENEDPENSAENKSSPKKKKSKKSIGVDAAADISLVENEGIQESTSTELSSKKKKKGKKSIGLVEVADVCQVENEDIQESTSTENSPKKKKKGRKSTVFNEVAEVSQVENDIQESTSTENSSKKKKKGKKSIGFVEVADVSLVEIKEMQDSTIIQTSPKKMKKGNNVITEMKAEEDVQNSPFHASLKKKNKKSMSSSHVEAELEDSRESSMLFSSKKRKLRESDTFNDTPQKSKNKSRNVSEIEMNISAVAKEDSNLKTPLKSKKDKNAVGLESSVVSIEDEGTMHSEKTPLSSKKVNKRRKSGRKSIM